MKFPYGLRPTSRRFLVPLCAMILPPALSAATVDKANNNDALNATTSWQGGVLPATTDVIRWGNIVTGPTTVSTGANVSYAGIIVADPAGPVTINDNTLTIGASGIDMSAATQDLTINSTLSLTANQNWTLATGRSLTIGGAFASTTGIVTQAGGTVTLQGVADNSGGRFTVGGAVDNPGLLILNKTSTTAVHATGSSDTALTINANGTVRIAGTGDDQIFNNSEVNVSGGTLDMNGHIETIDGLIGSATGVVTNTAAGTTGVLTVGGNNHGGTVGGVTTYSGALKDGAGQLALTKIGSGVQILNGALSYTGQTTISAGGLRIDSAAGLTSSNILLTGGTLQLTANSAGAFANLAIGSGAGQIRFGATNTGGFSAQGSNVTIALNSGAPLTWGQTDFVQSNQALQFGGTQATHTLTLNNALNLSASTGTNGTLRTITVNEGGAAFEGDIAGTISGEGSLVVNGSGALRLSGNVTNRGGIFANGGVVGYDSSKLSAGVPVQVASSGAVAYVGAGSAIPASFYQTINGVGSAITVAAIGTNNAAGSYATNVDFSVAPAALRSKLYLGATQQNGAVNFTGTLTPVDNKYRLGGGNGVLALTVANTLTGANSVSVKGGGVVRVENVAQNLTGPISIDGGVLELRGDNANISTAGGIVVNGVGALGSLGAPTGYTYSGTIFSRLRGGVLTLQSMKDATGALIGTQTVTLRGGAISAHDTDGNAGTITVQNVVADNGYNVLAAQPQSAASNHDQLTITNLSRTAGLGATVEFRSQFGPLAAATGDNGNINVTNLNGSAAGNVNGILGGWAYASGGAAGATNASDARSFATLTANGVGVATPDYATAAAKTLSSATAASNVLVAGAGTGATVSAFNVVSSNLTINSLITESPVDVKSNAVLTIGTGGLIMRQAQVFLTSTDGTGKITSGLPSGELFVNATDATAATVPDLRITTLSIVDNGTQAVSLVKTGANKLTIGGGANNTYTGKTIVNLGNLQFDFRGGTGILPGGDIVVRSGGTFSTGLNTGTDVTIPNNVFLDGGTLRNENNGGGGNAVATYTGTLSIASLPGSSASIDPANNKIILGPAATLTGSGDLTKISGSPFEIQTANTTGFTGSITLAAGNIDVTGSGKLPVTDLIFTGGTLNLSTTPQAATSVSGTSGTITGSSTVTTDTLTVNQNIDTTFHGIVNNTTLIKSGTGSLYLSGSGDNGAGALVVNSGTLGLAKASTNGVHAAGGGTSLTINGGGIAQLGGTFTNTGASGNNTPPADIPANYVDQIYYQATVAVNGGTFDLNGRSESFNGLTGSASGTITNSAASTTSVLMTGQDNASSSFAGSIQNGAGTTSYVKLGTGTQTFSGTSTYTGPTEVRAGTLSVTGSLSGSTVAVKGGATLAGTGSVFGLTTEALAVISPGLNAPGTLNVTGSAAFGGGTLSLQLNGTTPGTQYDQLTAGSVSLTSNVDLTLTLGFTPTPFVDSFTIVSNTGNGAVSGAGLFSYNGTPLANGDRFFVGQNEFQIAYNGGSGNDVVLQAVPEPNAAALLMIGAALGLARRRRK